MRGETIRINTSTNARRRRCYRCSRNGSARTRKSNCNGSEHLFVSVSPSVVSARLSSSSGNSHVGSSSISDGRLISSSLRKMRARACVCRSSRERRAENTTISRNKEGEHEEKSRYTLSLSFSSNWPVLAQPRLASLIIIMIIMLRLCYCYTRAYTALAHIRERERIEEERENKTRESENG